MRPGDIAHREIRYFSILRLCGNQDKTPVNQTLDRLLSELRMVRRRFRP